MANTCFNTIRFFCEKDDKESLKAIRDILKRFKNARENERYLNIIVEEVFKDLNEYPDIDKRNILVSLDKKLKSDQKDKYYYFDLEIESAWTTVIGAVESVSKMWFKEKYPKADVKIVSIGEESSSEIYVNTDINRTFFTPSYFLYLDSDGENSKYFYPETVMELKEDIINFLDSKKYLNREELEERFEGLYLIDYIIREFYFIVPDDIYHTIRICQFDISDTNLIRWIKR